MPSKRKTNWLFNDVCCLLIASFDWKIGVFQQTIETVYYILNVEKKIFEMHWNQIFHQTFWNKRILLISQAWISFYSTSLHIQLLQLFRMEVSSK